MNNRPKKPPVNINDLNTEGAGQKEEHTPGPLHYVENKTSSGAPKSKLNLTQLVLAVGLSIVLSFVIAQFTLTSKGDAITLLENQRLLESRVGGVETDIDTESGRIDNVINAQAGYATRSELAGLATTGALDTLRNLVTGYGSSITSLGSQYTNLDNRVKALEEAINGTAPIVGGGSFDYRLTHTSVMGNYTLSVRPSKSGEFRLRITLGAYGFSSGFSNYTSANVKEYYTPPFSLQAGEWTSRNLPPAVGILLSSYRIIYVEALPVIGSEEEGLPEW